MAAVATTEDSTQTPIHIQTRDAFHEDSRHQRRDSIHKLLSLSQCALDPGDADLTSRAFLFANRALRANRPVRVVALFFLLFDNVTNQQICHRTAAGNIVE